MNIAAANDQPKTVPAGIKPDLENIEDYNEKALAFLAWTNTTFETEFKEHAPYWPEDKEARDIFNITLRNSASKYRFTFGQSIASSTVEHKKLITEVNDSVVVYAGLSFTNQKISVSRQFTVTKENNFSLPYEEVETMAADMFAEYAEKADARNKTSVKKFKDGLISRLEMIRKLHNANTSIGVFEQCISRAIQRECKKTVVYNVEKDVKQPPTAYDVLTCLTKYDPGTFDNFCGDFGYDADSRKAYKAYKAVLREWKNIELLFTPDQLELLQEIN